MRIRSQTAGTALLLAIVLMPCAAARPQMSQEGRKPGPTKPAARAEAGISGTVTDTETGRPLARAQVMVFSPGSGIMGGAMGGAAGGVVPVPMIGCSCERWGSSGSLQYQTVTDAHGRFAIQEIIPGAYQVSAVAPGYAEQFYQVKGGSAGPNLFELRPRQRRNDIDIRLPRQAMLTGRVIDDHGQPVPSAYIRVMQHGRSTWNHKKLLPVTATVTDDRGDFRVFGLLPGSYYLEARYQPGSDLASFSPADVARRFLVPGQDMGFGSLGSLSPLFFYPGTTDAADAKPVVVRAGQVRSGLDIFVRPLTPAERAKLKPQPPPLPRGDCKESGTVTNAITGQPLDHAWVLFGPPLSAATQPPMALTSTGADGHFAFHSISCIKAQPLLAWKNGFAENFLSFHLGRPPGPPGLARSRWEINDVHFALVPTSVITGRITDAHGKAAACVRVALIGNGNPSHPGMWRYPMRQTVTDDRGRYRFFQLPPGRYSVAARIRYAEGVATVAPIDAHSPPRIYHASPYVYYPSTSSLAKAKTIRVAPGEEVKGLDFSVKPVETYSISGIVKGPALQAVGRGLRVVLVPAKSPRGPLIAVHQQLHQQLPNASGKFRVPDVTSGSYVLWATANVHLRSYAAWARVTVGHRSIVGVVLDPHLGWSIPVHLSVEGQPRGYFLYNISAVEQDAPLLPQTAVTRLMSAGGTSELQFLFPGHYLVRAGVRRGKPVPIPPLSPFGSIRRPRPIRPHFPFEHITRPPPNWYVKSARFGGRDVRAGLTVPMRKPTGTLDVTVSWHGAQVRGTVVNSRGEPAPYATVVLVPKKKSDRVWWLFRYGPLYERNHFLFRGVPPGRYRLFAWKDVKDGAWFDPKFLKREWKQGQKVILSEGQTKTFQLLAREAQLPAAESRH